MPPFGLAEHRPDQPVEQVDCLVGQAGGEVERDRDQSGMPALAFVSGDMLHRGAAGFAGELGKAGLMHAMPAPGSMPTARTWSRRSIRPSIASGFVASGIWRSQASQLWLVSAAALRQRIQPTALIGRQPVGQPTLDLAPRLIADVDAEPFECAGRRDDDPPLPAFLHHQPGEMSEPIVLDRMRQQPAGQIRSPRRVPKGRNPKPVLQFGGMALSVALSGE